MRNRLIWFAGLGVLKTVALYTARAGVFGGATDYLVVVGTMLVAMVINAGLAVGYTMMTRPRDWRGTSLLLAGLVLFDYLSARSVLWFFGIAQ
jgi:hypothetical protein